MRIAMIPARMGSQRLKKKNLLPLNGVPLIQRAIRRCQESNVFDEIYVNSENEEFAPYAEAEGAKFHRRPEELGSNAATSEDFVAEFLQKIDCDRVFQIHSIAPLASATGIREFVEFSESSGCDTVLSCVNEQIECALDGEPVNFSFEKKTNSQDLSPLQRITWSLSSWTRCRYLEAYDARRCATYAGKVGFYPLDRFSGIVIKRQEDLDMAEALLGYIGDGPEYGSR
ncbi:MAG: NTP transferase domain-containing protein [Maricaulis sp.]|uniref:acylneuraminate cytidylyltransferase family protein n=1 Tax=Maricaulis sp. TaxID=1486257 RepID=UPI002633F0A5|nr:NTP transferase domain-containing protein [Maricaulis sp.]MDM7984936.1 NTP transferase domain-containing protein [Maricaulis sp.]